MLEGIGWTLKFVPGTLAKQLVREHGIDLFGFTYLKRLWRYAGHLARADARHNPAANVLHSRQST